MSATVDERIVAAKFDASDFEKGVNKTLKKLDELKKSLDMKDTTKSVNDLSEKVKTSTDSMSSSLDKLTNRLTTFTGMIKQQILSGLAEEVSNVFLKMERAVTGFVRSLGSEQVSVGMAKYEQMLTSVRMMIAAGETQADAYEKIGDLRDYSDQTSYSLSQMTDALSKFRAAGTKLDEATKSVQGIANACAIAGVNAQDAARAYYNLAQAYSSGSLKYTDYRSLELLNMTTEEFKKNLLEAAVEAQTLKKINKDTYQTIKKEGSKVTAGKKVTIKNIQDALRYGFVTTEVMNKLFGGKYYFTEKEFRKYKDKYTDKNGDISEEGRRRAIADAKKDFNSYAVDAYLAAREARNFTDVINTLKDVVSTGWSTTFENLFGKLESATEFFTKLAEGPLAEVIYKIGEYRNAILEYWNGVGTGYEGTGAKMFQDTILNIADALGILFRTFQQILPGFDEVGKEGDGAQETLEGLGHKLRLITADIATTSLRIKEAMKDFNTWMNSPIMENGPTRIEVIRKTISNLMSVFSIAYKIFEKGFNAIYKAIVIAEPIFNGLFIALEKITEPLADLNNSTKPFEDLEHSANNLLIILKPISDALGGVLGILGEVGKFFVEMAISTVTMNLEFFSDVLRVIIDLFTGGQSSQSLENGKTVLQEIGEALEGIKDACKTGLNTVKEFLGSLIADIRVLFGLTGENGEKIQNGGVFENLKNFFDNNQFIKDAKAWVDQAIVDVTNFIKSIPSRLMSLGANIYDTLYKLFFTEETTVTNGKKETKSILTPLGEWTDQAIKDIKAFFVSLPNKIIEGVGNAFDWINSIFDEWFGNKKAPKKETEESKKQEKENPAIDRFNEFLASTTQSIKDWFEDLPNKIRKAFSSIGNFFTRLFSVIGDFLFGKKVTKHIKVVDFETGELKPATFVTRIKSGFSKWLSSAARGIKAFIAKIPEYIKAGIQGAGDIIATVINALFGNKANEGQATDQQAAKKVEDGIKKPFLNIDWTSILTTLKEIGTTLLNQIARIFTGSDDVEINSEWFAQAVANGITWIKTKAEEAFKAVEDFIVSIPGKIAEWFTGEGKNDNGEEQGPVGKAIKGFGEAIGGFIADLPTTIARFVEEAILALDQIFDKLYKSIIGDGKDTNTRVEKYAENELGYPVSYSHTQFKTEKQKSSWEKFIEQVGKVIQTVIETLPTWIVKGVNLAIVGISAAFNKITEWLNGKNLESELKKAADKAKESGKTITESVTESAIEGTKEGTKDAGEENGLITATKSLGTSIYTLFTVTIPPMISAAWTFISDKASGAWEGIKNIFNGTPQTDFEASVSEFAKKVKTFITTDVPKAISEAWKFVTTFISTLFSKKDPYKVDLTNLSDSEKAYYERYIEAIQKPFKDAEKKVDEGEGSPNSFLTSLKDSILEGFANIGPAILNGLAKALDWISNIVTIVYEAITGKKKVGDQIEKAYGKEKPELVAALKNIGESIKNFFLDVLPTFIGSAIGALLTEAPKWFGKLFLGINEAMAEASGDGPSLAETVEGQIVGSGEGHEFENNDDAKKSIIDRVQSFISSIVEPLAKLGSDGTLQSVAVIVSVAFLLSKLKEVMSFSRELEGVADTMKWTAITLAVIAIASILNSLVDLTKNGTATQIENAEKIIDKISGLLEKVVWIVGLFTGGKVIGLIEKFVSKDNALNKALKKVSVKNSRDTSIVINNTLAEAGKTGATLTDALTGFVGKIAGYGGTAAGVKLVGDAVNGVVSDSFDTISGAFVELGAGIDTVMDFLNPFVDKLAKTGNSIDSAIATIGKVGALFTRLFEVFDNLYENATGGVIKDGPNAVVSYITKTSNGTTIGAPQKTTVSMSAFFDELESRVLIFLDLANFMEKLLDIAEKLKNTNDVSVRISRFIGELSNADFIDLFTKLFDTIYTSYKNSDLYTNEDKFSRSDTEDVMSLIRSSFEMLSNVLSLFAEDINNLSLDNANSLTAALNMIKELNESFKDKGGDLAVLGRKIRIFGSSMIKFYEEVKEIPGFKENEVRETKDKISSIIELIKGLADSGQISAKYGVDFAVIDQMGEHLMPFATSIGSFFTSLDTAIPDESKLSKERSESLLNAVRATSEMLSAIRELALIEMDPNMMIENKALSINGLIDKIFGEYGDYPNSAKMAALIYSFTDTIAKLMENESNASPYKLSGMTIAGYIFEGIQEAFDTNPNYQVKITPFIKVDEAGKQISDYFAENGVPINASSTTNLVGLNNETDAKLAAIQESLASIDSRLESLNSNIATTDDVRSAIGGWQIRTDTGRLVGVMTPAIDRAIGDRIWLLQRSNAVK